MSPINLPLTTGRIKHIEENWNEFALGSTASLSRIYERLRKRSYRKLKEAARLTEIWWNIGDETALDAIVPWDHYEHLAYLDGVRDALNAVAGRQR